MREVLQGGLREMEIYEHGQSLEEFLDDNISSDSLLDLKTPPKLTILENFDDTKLFKRTAQSCRRKELRGTDGQILAFDAEAWARRRLYGIMILGQPKSRNLDR
jgi:hypothetical protein